MNRQVVRMIIITMLSVIMAGCADSKKNKIVYMSSGDEFVLSKKCVAGVRMDPYVFNSKEIYSVSLRLKNTEDCSQKLNNIIKENIGNRLFTYLNGNLLIDAYIASELKTENGFRMSVSNKELAEDILSFYR